MSISTVVKKLSTAAIAATVIVLGMGAVAQATVLTFDDLGYELPPIASRYNVYAGIPNGYGGFNWDNFYFIDGSSGLYSYTGYDNGRVELLHKFFML